MNTGLLLYLVFAACLVAWAGALAWTGGSASGTRTRALQPSAWGGRPSMKPLCFGRPGMKPLCMSEGAGAPETGGAGNAPVEEVSDDETAEEKYKREKLAEIAERKAAEVFVSRSTGKYECQACGYIYDTAVGMPKKGIEPGTPFDDLEVFRCPQCGANKKYFIAETETLSGFKENLKYGFGGNSMTAGAKSNLIYGALGIFVVLFLSGYLLE